MITGNNVVGQSSNRFYYKKNRLKQLRAFCHAAQTGSISKAAERLFLSQPSVSLQIKALEREFDTILFERRGPSITLTPAGKTLYELAIPLIEGIDSLADTFAMHQGQVESGEIDIAAGESAILYILPEVMRRFTQQYPTVKLRIHNVTGKLRLAQLRANEVDFAVGSLLEVPKDINFHPVLTYDPVLITPPDHPLLKKPNFVLKDLAPYGLIMPAPQLSTWGVAKTVFREHEIDYKVTLEAGSWEVIKKYVALGLGLSIVTSICLTGTENIGTISLQKYFPKRHYGIVMRKGKFLVPAAKRFIEMMDPDFFSQPEPSLDADL